MANKKTPTVEDVLKRMRTLLRKGWTRRTLARNAKGRKVDPCSPSAVTFCIFGAKERAVHELHAGYTRGVEGINLIERCAKTYSVANYNDAPKRTLKEILSVVNCAIKKAAQPNE